MIPAPARRLAIVAIAASLIVAACAGGSTAAPIQPSSAVPSQAPSAAPASGPASAVPSQGPSAAPASGAAGGIPAGCPTSPPAAMAADATATVTFATEKGNIGIQVKGALAPNAAGNFVALAQCGYYTGTVFHRLVPAFVIQGGDGQFGRTPNVDTARVGQGGPGYAFADDPVTTPYKRGTVAMANSGPNTNGSQFFICLADLANLPPNYSVFGSVVSGMETVDAIAAMPNSGQPNNQAIQPVAITKTTVTKP